MLSLLDAKRFKKAAIALQKEAESGKFEHTRRKGYVPSGTGWSCGLCFMLNTGDGVSYDIMPALLEHTCLGNRHIFTEERELFLEFIAYSLTEEDILEIWESCGEED